MHLCMVQYVLGMVLIGAGLSISSSVGSQRERKDEKAEILRVGERHLLQGGKDTHDPRQVRETSSLSSGVVRASRNPFLYFNEHIDFLFPFLIIKSLMINTCDKWSFQHETQIYSAYWQNLIACHICHVSFCKVATNNWALLWRITSKINHHEGLRHPGTNIARLP